MTVREHVSTGNAWEQRFGYARAVRVGDLVVTTGTVSMNPDNTPFIPDDGFAQAARCFEIIDEALAALGATRFDVVRTRMFVTDIDRADDFGRAHKAFFADHAPCLTMVEVSRLISPGFLVEIEAEAVVAEHDEEDLDDDF